MCFTGYLSKKCMDKFKSAKCINKYLTKESEIIDQRELLCNE